MLNRILKPAMGLTAVAVALACVTINVYFPEAEVKDLSEQIEQAIMRRAGAEPAEPAAEPESGNGGASAKSERPSAFEIALGTVLYYGLGASPAYAQQDEVAAPEIENPAIRKIIQSRSARVQELNRYKASGAIGENNKALTEARDLNPLPLPERAAAQKLIREENADRERMFKEIAAATGTDLSQLPRIQETYAETLRANARPGDWIQMPNGQWRQK
jgi:uncharacterized protein YdbL (DUF1318 family)